MPRKTKLDAKPNGGWDSKKETEDLSRDLSRRRGSELIIKDKDSSSSKTIRTVTMQGLLAIKTKYSHE